MPTVEMGWEKCAARHGGWWAARVSTVGRRNMAGVTEEHLLLDDAALPGGWAEEGRMTIPAGTMGDVEDEAGHDEGDERHGAALPGLRHHHSQGDQHGM